MYFRRSTQGFTLIELLVVIAIIGTLASVVLASLNSARVSARDAKRMADLRNLAVVLELYYHDNSRYPNETWCDSSIGAYGHPCSDISDGQDGWSTGSAFYTQIVDGGYGSLPLDPINNTNHYYYYEPSNTNEPNSGDQAGQGYFLRVRLEETGSLWAVCGGTMTGYRDWCN